MENIENIKILLVVSESKITEDNGKDFVTSLKNFTDMFKNVEMLEGSVALCISKVRDVFDLEEL